MSDLDIKEAGMNDKDLDEIRQRMQESLIEANRDRLREQYGMQFDNLDSSRLSPEAKKTCARSNSSLGCSAVQEHREVAGAADLTVGPLGLDRGVE
jgi:hypothetical protein